MVIAQQPTKTPLVIAACGHGIINTLEHAYIESKATGQAYCDTVCLVTTEAEYAGDNVRWLDTVLTLDEFKEELEVVSHG